MAEATKITMTGATVTAILASGTSLYITNEYKCNCGKKKPDQVQDVDKSLYDAKSLLVKSADDTEQSAKRFALSYPQAFRFGGMQVDGRAILHKLIPLTPAYLELLRKEFSEVIPFSGEHGH